MSVIQRFILEKDDDTYIYGGLEFYAECIDNHLIEPYIHNETETKIIKYYKSKNLFVVYINNEIKQLIFTLTCWSDDFSLYNIENNIAISYKKTYHFNGKRIYDNNVCNIDFTDFIVDNCL